MRMRDMILQRRVGMYRKEMKAMNTLSFACVVRHLAKVEVFPNLGVSGGGGISLGATFRPLPIDICGSTLY
ncbi:hypothetical protein Tco_1298132, partial [Tanacetum coccineum]